MQISLFDSGMPAFNPALEGVERRDLGDGAWVEYLPNWLRGHAAVYRDLAGSADWKHERRVMYERRVDVPRLTAPAPRAGTCAALLEALAACLAEHYGVTFEGISLAWYRDGSDSVAPHGDRLGRLCDDTVVAIVSVGAPRRFILRPVAGGHSLIFSPGWGDLLVMGGTCQRTWLHSVPKVARADPRISIQLRATNGPRPEHGVRRYENFAHQDLRARGQSR